MAPTAFRLESLLAAAALGTLAVAVPRQGARAQEIPVAWQTVATQTHASFRGLSVAHDGTVWVGGTKGTVMRSTDAGRTWAIDTVAGAGSWDFRGVAAIDSLTAAVAVSAADTGRIYRTDDGGRTWHLQFRDERRGVFLDGIACWNSRRCEAVGDPIAAHFLVVTTDDGGAHWTEHDTSATPSAMTGEAAFAASNTTVIVGPDGRTWLATGGGPAARVWRSSDYGQTWHVASTPIAAGTASAGIFSLAFCDDQHGIAVGGNYRTPDSAGAHAAVTVDGGATWTLSDAARVTPYLSGVVCVARGPRSHAAVAVGPSGTFVTGDEMHWSRADRTPFNALAVVNGSLVAVGANGAAATSALPASP